MQLSMHYLTHFFNNSISEAPILLSGIKDTVVDIASTTYSTNMTFRTAYNEAYSEAYNHVVSLGSMANIMDFLPASIMSTTSLFPGQTLLAFCIKISDIFAQLSAFMRALLAFYNTDLGFAALMESIIKVLAALLCLCMMYGIVYILPKKEKSTVEQIIEKHGAQAATHEDIAKEHEDLADEQAATHKAIAKMHEHLAKKHKNVATAHEDVAQAYFDVERA